jgi:sterol desaturase/sphingolipid hydroxylase (fatty acid hydroxylase superfamily)
MSVAVEMPLLVAGAYAATTLALWVSHWFSHQRKSPLRGFHINGHHRLYPTARRCLSERFLYGAGREDSIYTFLPWLGLELVLFWWLLPASQAAVCTATGALTTSVFSYIHTQFHLRDSGLARWAQFRRAREIHFVHHDLDANYAVLDHFWDRVFRTYVVPCSPPSSCEKAV